jgi:hypothetical protein
MSPVLDNRERIILNLSSNAVRYTSSGGPGLLRTTEYLTQQSLNLDVGKMIWDQPNRFTVWAGYRWWKNKFGINPIQPNGEAEHDPNQPGGKVFPFTLERTWLLGTTLAF